MTKKEKLIQQLTSLPTDMRFSDVRKVLEWHGYELRRSSGSHFMFRKDGFPRLDIPKRDGKTVARAYLKMIADALELKG
ncbi:MAG: type II toxin-antitoxin system HicA family toxin [Deinococcota bacterium]